MKSNENPIIIITGPTACGKTSSSIELAKKINGEIISADSMQVYKLMDIGTAKIKPEEMQGIRHYLIDEFYPDFDFSIAVFQKYAKKYIQKIQEKGKIPIVVGGTGFYINSIIFNNDFKETFKDKNYRKELENEAILNGNEYLHSKLKKIDLESFQKIHPNNVKKVIRALEFYHETGQKISEHNKLEKNREQIYKNHFFVLNMDRKLLYDRINKRVDIMFEKGLLDEVKTLLELGYTKNLTSMQAIGYKELIMHLEGEISLELAIDLIKRNTRRFAKRQLTWFKTQFSSYKMVDTTNLTTEDILNKILKYI